jgi:hypothetical protein
VPPAKAAQRSLAESMARHLWPSGVHVSLIVLEGVVDLERTRARLKVKGDDLFGGGRCGGHGALVDETAKVGVVVRGGGKTVG